MTTSPAKAEKDVKMATSPAKAEKDAKMTTPAKAEKDVKMTTPAKAEKSKKDVELGSISKDKANSTPEDKDNEKEGTGSGEEENAETDESKKKQNGCQKCCGSIMKILAHDALYGSFVGPHPVSFWCICKPCKGCFSKRCVRPATVSSLATKIMYFIMLGFVCLFSCFFIIPWPTTGVTTNATDLADFYPCQKGKLVTNWEHNGGCLSHAGYFMAYRCFLAFATLMLTNCLILLCVRSTKDSPHRTKIHQGFWCYKYLYLGVLMLMYFLMLNGESDPEGYFEFGVSIVGNIANLLFSFIEVAYILDIAEFWVIGNRTSKSNWADFLYWMFTSIIFLLDFIFLGFIFNDFGFQQTFGKNVTVFWPLDNCLEGDKGDVDWLHIGVICGCMIVCILLIVAMSFKAKFETRFPYTGWLQVSLLVTMNLVFLWSGLHNSPHVHSRPRCNWALEAASPFSPTNHGDVLKVRQEGSLDIYYTHAGLVHGLLAIIGLLYFAFVHGPRSDTAPLSILYYVCISNNARVPVFPDEDDSPKEFLEAVEKFEVWDDEKEEVNYSWSLFYLMMILGGFSLMMSMTNFTNPWGGAYYNSSMIALGCKFGTATLITFTFILVLLIPCSKVNPENELHKQRRKKRHTIEDTPVEMSKTASNEPVVKPSGTEETSTSPSKDVTSNKPTTAASPPTASSPPAAASPTPAPAGNAPPRPPSPPKEPAGNAPPRPPSPPKEPAANAAAPAETK